MFETLIISEPNFTHNEAAEGTHLEGRCSRKAGGPESNPTARGWQPAHTFEGPQPPSLGDARSLVTCPSPHHLAERLQLYIHSPQTTGTTLGFPRAFACPAAEGARTGLSPDSHPQGPPVSC